MEEIDKDSVVELAIVPHVGALRPAPREAFSLLAAHGRPVKSVASLFFNPDLRQCEIVFEFLDQVPGRADFERQSVCHSNS